MRKISLILSALVLVMIATTSASAQYNVVKFDALGLLNKRINVGFERSFLKQGSIVLNYETGSYASAMNTSQGSYTKVYDLRLSGFIPELRYYPFHKKRTAPLGFFFGPAFRYSGIKETFNNFELKGNVFNYGLVTGYKFNYEIIVAEFLLGYGSGKISEELKNTDRSAYANYIDVDTFDEIERNLRLEISIGVVFPKIKTKTSGKY